MMTSTVGRRGDSDYYDHMIGDDDDEEEEEEEEGGGERR